MPHPSRLELELQLGAEVLGPLEEELAEEHRGPLILDQQPDTVRATRRCPFEAPAHARVRGPPDSLHRREVPTEHRTQARVLQPVPRLPDGTAQLEAPLNERRRGGEVACAGVENHQATADENPPPGVLDRAEHVQDLEAQVLALHAVREAIVHKELVAQVTALVIEARSPRPASAPESELRPHEVVGVEEVQLGGVEVELRKGHAEQAHLKPVAAAGLPQAPDAERAAEGDEGRVDAPAAPLSEHSGVAIEVDSPVVRVEPRLPLVREEWAEHVVVGQENALQRAGGLCR